MAVSKDLKKIEDVIGELTKKYGDNTLQQLDSENVTKVECVSTGLPSLDYILGGGVPKGRIIEIFGPESGGKTTMALTMLARCQEDGKKVVYIDAENGLDPRYVENLGVDMSKLIINQPNSGEEALDIVEKFCQTGAVSIIVVDSVAQLVPRSVGEKEIDGTANIGTTARLLSQTLPRISNAAARTGTIVIFINQIRMKIGMMYGNPETTPGGLALKFAAGVRLEVRAKKTEEKRGKEGNPVSIRVKKNKIAPPFRETELFLVYGEGFDLIDDVVTIGITKGVIVKSGGWYEYDGQKVQGLDTLTDLVAADKKLYTKLLKACA